MTRKRRASLALIGLVVAVLTGLNLTLANPAGSNPLPQAPTISTKVVVSEIQVKDAFLHVYGSVQTVTGTPIAGLTITIFINDKAHGNTSSSIQGRFGYTMAKPAAGTYKINAYFNGDSTYRSSSGALQVTVPGTTTKTPKPASTKAASTISLSIDPIKATPGSLVKITGKLVNGKTPIPSALLVLTSDYGLVDAVSDTASNGTFEATIAIPDSKDFPSSFTVTVSFNGDSYYSEVTSRIKGSIVAAPGKTSNPTATTETAADDEDDDAGDETSTDSVSPSASPTSAPSGNNHVASGEGNSGMVVVRVVFYTVALVAVGALIILGIVSHRQKRLARNERRGFGTDFGKDL